MLQKLGAQIHRPHGLRDRFQSRLGVGDREARADRQRGKLVDGVAPGALIRELKLVVDNDRVP